MICFEDKPSRKLETDYNVKFKDFLSLDTPSFPNLIPPNRFKDKAARFSSSLYILKKDSYTMLQTLERTIVKTMSKSGFECH